MTSAAASVPTCFHPVALIAALSVLQEEGFDTVDANRELGLPDDCREYTSVFNILSELGVKSIQLMTNNPRKVNTIARLGIDITKRIPCVVPANMVNQVGMPHVLAA